MPNQSVIATDLRPPPTPPCKGGELDNPTFIRGDAVGRGVAPLQETGLSGLGYY